MTTLTEAFTGSGKKNVMYETHSCCFGDGQQNYQARDPYSETVFQCPVKCEGDKTYSVTGNCPVCNKNLEQVVKVHQRYYL